MRKVSEFSDSILQWYDVNRRRLPWRTNRNPFSIWISEVMLQQTQVRTALPYYERFLQRFPEVTQLAAATEEEVLALWAGLGYYARARNLHHAAQTIVRDFGGKFPSRYEDILRLPGVGKYTAGAISAIAFGERRPAVDGNVVRVISRVHALRSRRPAEWFRRKAAEWIPAERVSDFTQGLMELGALICTPGNPACADCPVAKLCKTCRLGLRPRARTKPIATIEKLQLVLLVARNGRSTLLVQLRGGFIPGRWGLPHVVVPAGTDVEGVARQLALGFGCESPIRRHGTVHHAISRRRIAAAVFSATLPGRRPPGNACSWARPEEAERLLTSSLFRKAIILAGEAS
jgi:A/G-specific adenine glycosylase